MGRSHDTFGIAGVANGNSKDHEALLNASGVDERIVGRVGGTLLFPVAAYVVVAACWNLWTKHHGEFSAPRFVVALLAIPVMRYLATRVIDLADRLGSRALRTDAVDWLMSAETKFG